MSVINSLLLAFSMFSRIPMPKVEWNEKNMRYMMACFPLVGLAVGLLVLGWGKFAAALKLTKVLFACGTLLIPAAVTGGIHLDGFCDTVDALLSHAAPEKKRAILKDPHVGSFAVITACGYMLLYFSLCCELSVNTDTLIILLCAHVLSRILSATAVILLPADNERGTLHSFSRAADKTVVCAALVTELIACEVVAVMISPVGGGLMLICGAACFILLKRMAQRDFEGMRGDLAGFFLQVNELASLICIVTAQKGGWL